MSRYDADDVYCLPGSSVFINKAGISDQELLDQYEADFTTIRLLELAKNAVEGEFDLNHLCQIHAYLFQDVYEWAVCSLSYAAPGRTEMYSAMEAAFFGDEKPLATLMFEISE